MYVKVETITTPRAVTIRKAVEIAKEAGAKASESYINDELGRNKLNWGLSFDNTSGKGPDPENQHTGPNGEENCKDFGQKIVVLDEVWEKWLAKKIAK